MCAMPHKNTTQEQSFVHFCTDGEEDPPSTCDGEVGQECATVTPREGGGDREDE